LLAPPPLHKRAISHGAATARRKRMATAVATICIARPRCSGRIWTQCVEQPPDRLPGDAHKQARRRAGLVMCCAFARALRAQTPLRPPHSRAGQLLRAAHVTRTTAAARHLPAPTGQNGAPNGRPPARPRRKSEIMSAPRYYNRTWCAVGVVASPAGQRRPWPAFSNRRPLSWPALGASVPVHTCKRSRRRPGRIVYGKLC
jgi:hypothetical protein